MARLDGHEECRSCESCGYTDCPDCDSEGKYCTCWYGVLLDRVARDNSVRISFDDLLSRLGIDRSELDAS